MNTLLKPLPMFIVGGIMGIAAKYLDIYTSNLGNMFSELSIWILMGVVISIFSKTPKSAAVNVFLFCIGMLITYYTTCELTGSIYGVNFIIGWTIFSLFSPVLAWFTWLTKEKGIFPKIIAVGIILVTVLGSVIIFPGPRVWDFPIVAAEVYLLFIFRRKR